MTSPDAFSPMGHDLFGEPIKQERIGVLSQKFLFAPLTALDARSGDWLNRKQSWLDLGIESEVGREDGLVGNRQDAARRAAAYHGKEASGRILQGTSVFDPVLCELAYRWWAHGAGVGKHTQVVDPFAGGSVRGIVASLMGYKYWGCDLRPEQVIANRAQAAKICANSAFMPEWVCGDSGEALDEAPVAQMVLTCPPYGDLEVYSEDPRDLSTMDYPVFLKAYLRILRKAKEKLWPGAFMVVVVGDFREPKTGAYRGFVADTIVGLREMGLELYNDAILLTPIGTVAVQIGSQFEKWRKLGKVHQNVLVFRRK